MIRHVHIENFRCIRKADIDLGPVTVLVGPNASGKSTVLRALDPHRSWGQPDAWRHGDVTASRVMVTLANEQMATRGHHAVAGWQGEAFRLLRLDLNLLRRENQLSEARTLAADGSNLPNMFATLSRAKQGAVAKQLCELTGVFADVGTIPTSSGQHAFRFQDRWDPSVWYTANDVSDGSMLLLAYLLLQHEEPPIPIVGIEEPDRGLHPYLMGQLMSLLRRMSEGMNGRPPIQFILATHSSELLDHVKPEEVRFLTRSPESGELEVESIDTTKPDWAAAFEEYRESLGGVWLSGSVGGVPGA